MPRLSPEQKAEQARRVREGPDPAVDGVVRWRRLDLQRRIEARLSVRPQHPKSDPEAQGAFKKLRRDRNRGPAGSCPGQTLEVWFQDEARVGQQGTLTCIRASRSDEFCRQ